ncbi:MAG: sulfurtransferase TusA family protein [Gammaproteobacteria bacterium]
MEIKKTLDASGLDCPLPLLKAKFELSKLLPGEVLKVIATDPSSLKDFESFSRISGNVLLEIEENNNNLIFIFEKRSD